MSSPVIYGSGNLPATTAKRYEYALTNNLTEGGSLIQTVICDWGDVGTNTPALNSLYGSGSDYVLTNILQEIMPGNLGKITLTYSANYTALPANTVVEQTSEQHISIQEHPSFSTWAAYWDDDAQRFPQGTVISGVDFSGISDFLVGSTTVTLTEYFDSMPSDNKANVGKLQAPSSGYGDATNWLVTGTTRSQQTNFWVRVTTYEYSAVAWNSSVYSSV